MHDLGEGLLLLAQRTLDPLDGVCQHQLMARAFFPAVAAAQQDDQQADQQQGNDREEEVDEKIHCPPYNPPPRQAHD